MNDAKKLVAKHQQLTHSEGIKVLSHIQRPDGDWYINTLMLENTDTPFKYKRQKLYKSLVGARVNLTYYPTIEEVAGIEFESMKVVRLRRA